MRVVLIIFVITFTLLHSVGCKQKEGSENLLIIAASSNIQQPLLEIIEQFQAQHSCEIQVSIASSGTLAQQIIQGAPYDIFLSANLEHAQHVYQKLPHQASKPKVYALGQLALFSFIEILNFKPIDLTHPNIKSIALPLPKIAPYGKAAIESLTPKLYEKIQHKLIYTNNTQQTLHYLKSHQVQAAFIHRSALLNSNFSSIMKDKHSLYFIPYTEHNPIQQSIIQVNYSYKNNNFLREEFYIYIFSEQAQAIFNKYHYLQTL